MHIFTHHGDLYFTLGIFQAINHLTPFGKIGRWYIQSKLAHHNLVQVLLVQQQGNAIDMVGIRS